MAVRKDPVLKEYYLGLSVRVGKKRAIVAVARKLVGRIRAAIRTGRQYEMGHKNAA